MCAMTALRRTLQIAASSLFVLMFFISTSAYTQNVPPTLSVVDMDFQKKVPEQVKKAILAATQNAVIKHKLGLRYRTWPETRNILTTSSPALAGCISSDCLKRTGEILKSPIGLSATVGGEAQIYDFEVSIHSLVTGERLARETGSCDICTPPQTGSAVRLAIIKALDSVTNIPKLPAPVATKEPVKPKPIPIDPTLPKIDVDLVIVPESASLQIGDRLLGEGSTSTKLSPGSYTLKADAEGFQGLEVPLNIDPNHKGPMMLRLYMAPKGDGSDTTVFVEREAGLFSDINHTGIGWTTLAVGTLSTVAGGVMLSLDGDTTCTEGPVNACPNVYETAGGGAALVGVGTVAITSGLFLLFWDTLAGEPSAKTKAK